MKVFAIGTLLALGIGAQATVYTFSGGPLTINDFAPGTPSPMTFNVSGLDGAIANVSLRMTGFSHTFPDDVGAVLFNPSNVGTLLFDGPSDGTSASNLNWLFDDSGLTTLPSDGALASGTFKPGQNDYDDIFTGAPAGPYNTAFAPYNGTAGAGSWKLFVEDFFPGDSGSIQNVDLIITTPVPEPATMSVLGLGVAALIRRRKMARK